MSLIGDSADVGGIHSHCPLPQVGWLVRASSGIATKSGSVILKQTDVPRSAPLAALLAALPAHVLRARCAGCSLAGPHAPGPARACLRGECVGLPANRLAGRVTCSIIVLVHLAADCCLRLHARTKAPTRPDRGRWSLRSRPGSGPPLSTPATSSATSWPCAPGPSPGSATLPPALQHLRFASCPD